MAGTNRKVGKQAEGYVIPVRQIERTIRVIRNQHVVLDEDLALLYGVQTKVLVQAVKRNSRRFPDDFMFQLTGEEFAALRSQIVTSKGRGGRRYPPYAFTEHGALMVASVLNSDRAVEVSVFVIRAFVRMRRMLADQRQFAIKLAELERKLSAHDKNFQVVFTAIKQLMQPPTPKKKPIGFGPD